MECKNCQTKIIGEKKFCNNCGAKVILNKLTFYSVTEEFFETFISWDNKFLKTFLHLFTKPQVVARNYLDGVRKRYMKPFPYIIIALTLYGLYMYYGRDQLNEYMEQIQSLTPKQPNQSPFQQKFMDEYNKKVATIVTNYFNVSTFMTIPFLAIINLILFRKNNFIEHCVALLYSYGHYMYFFIFLSFGSLIFNVPLVYIYPITISFMVLYHMYFYKRLYELSFLQIILKTLLYWLILFALIFIIFMAIIILGISVLFVLKTLGVF
jgi:hypothetical protein